MGHEIISDYISVVKPGEEGCIDEYAALGGMQGTSLRKVSFR